MAKEEHYTMLLHRVVSSYDLLNPVRTADQHDEDCACLRCVIDKARAYLKEREDADG